jgi:hypothetical protein
MRTLPIAILLTLTAAAGCAGTDNITPLPPTPTPPSPATDCVPNLNGVITAAQMQPALGITEFFYVTTANQPVELDSNQGSWNLSGSVANDAGFPLEATSLAGKWYATSFPTGQFTAFIDAAGTTEGIYSADDSGIYLLGSASTQQAPASGEVLLPYTTPVALYQFPLTVGATWTSTGMVTDGIFDGIPYAGVDTYVVTVDSEGSLVLPQMTFTQVLRVRTDVAVHPDVGVVSTKTLDSYLFQCLGEVARATGVLDDPTQDFTTASEIRVLGLEPNGGA